VLQFGPFSELDRNRLGVTFWQRLSGRGHACGLVDPSNDRALVGGGSVMGWRFSELLALTVLAAAGVGVALAYDRFLFALIFALAAGIGCVGIIHRTLPP